MRGIVININPQCSMYILFNSLQILMALVMKLSSNDVLYNCKIFRLKTSTACSFVEYWNSNGLPDIPFK